MTLTKGSKSILKEFDLAVKLRRAYILRLLEKYSKLKHTSRTRTKVYNSTHHNIMNNLRKPKSQYWKKKGGLWGCEGCKKVSQ